MRASAILTPLGETLKEQALPVEFLLQNVSGHFVKMSAKCKAVSRAAKCNRMYNV